MELTFDVYLSGPTVERADFNRMEFGKASRLVRSCGLTCFSPVELYTAGPGTGPNWTWKDYLRECVRVLTVSKALAQLDGWEESAGSRLENEIAVGLGLNRTSWNMMALHLRKIRELSSMGDLGAHIVI